MRFPVITASATIAALAFVAAVPALAQTLGTGIPLNQDDSSVKTPEQIAKQKATEEAYKATLKKLPDAKPADPWGNMRAVDTPKTTQAKPKTAPKKTNSAAN